MADATNPDAFDFKLYRYDPSLPAAIVSVVVFAILTVLHTWRLFRVRAYYFTAFTIGGICMSPFHRCHSSRSQCIRPVLTFPLQSRNCRLLR